MPEKKKIKKGDIVIAETSTSTWHYHLRQVGDEGLKLGGLQMGSKALCGKDMGWDTQLSLEIWDKPWHIPAKWCAECWEIYQKVLKEKREKT